MHKTGATSATTLKKRTVLLKLPMSFQEEPSQPSFQWHYFQIDDPNFQISGTTVLFIIVVISSVILVVALLYIYARWLCESLPTAVRHPPQPPVGLLQAKINDLPIALYHVSSNSIDAECCICLGIFVNEERVKLMPSCRHCFHSECVDKWLTVHSSCPLCRACVRVDSPV